MENMTTYKKSLLTSKYYLYGFTVSMRLTRIVNLLYLIQYAGISLIQFTFLQSLFVISQFIMEVPAGVIGDRLKRKTVVIVGLSLSIFAQLLIGSKGLFHIDISFVGLAIGFILEGFARAFMSGADEALFFEALRDVGLKDQYDKIVGRDRLVVAISLGGAAFLGALLYEYYAPLPYIGQICMTLCAIVIIFSIPESSKASVTQSNSESRGDSSLKSFITSLIHIRKETHIIFMFFLVCMVAAVTNTLFGIMPNYIAEIGFTPSQNGALFFAMALISGCVASQAYRLSKCTYRQLILITASCMGLGILLVYVGINKIMVFTGLALLYVILDILTPGAMKIFNFYAKDTVRATFLSSISFVTSAITMILYPLFGAGAQYMGMETLLLVVGVTVIALLLASCVLYVKLIDT